MRGRSRRGAGQEQAGPWQSGRAFLAAPIPTIVVTELEFVGIDAKYAPVPTVWSWRASIVGIGAPDCTKLLVAPNAMSLSLFNRLGLLTVDELGPEAILLFRPKPRAAD